MDFQSEDLPVVLMALKCNLKITHLPLPQEDKHFTSLFLQVLLVHCQLGFLKTAEKEGRKSKGWKGTDQNLGDLKYYLDSTSYLSG